MDFVAVVLFTHQVFHFIYNVYFYFDSRWYPTLSLFRIKSQPGAAYKSIFYKKKSSKNEKITLPHEFIFVFIRYCIGRYRRKSLAKSGDSKKRLKKGDGHIGELSVEEGGLKPSAHYGLDMDTYKVNIKSVSLWWCLYVLSNT